MINGMSVPICNHFPARQANRGRCPTFSFSFGGTPSPTGMKFCHKILETSSYHMVKIWSLCFTWSWNGTGTWLTPRQNYLC